jgi:putative heme-binding domain-containing protein
VDGKKWENPNSGFIARANPDGTDFEIFATGLRNTHEFVFDEYGNLISSDNDGDHAGESERLVHVVEGSDAGWRSNWQYGKYTDPKNNRYHVWMDEKLSVPHWEGQAAYIIPPIMNYHNGPTGMVYNPGTALGSAWKNKFFLVEFVGSSANSPIWAFGLKPKGASFDLDGETKVVTGILPTAIQFGPDGALYVGDWITGWETKDYGRIWKLDVTPDKNDLAAARKETLRLMQLKYAKQSPDMLYQLLGNADMRIRKKAQFELVSRGKEGFPMLEKAIRQTDNQLARIHGIWGIGQLARQDKTYAASLMPLLKDADIEIAVQAMKMLGDAEIKSVGADIMPFLTHSSARVRFYAAEVLGQLAYQPATTAILDMLRANNDEDLYLRHAGVLALARMGDAAPLVALSNDPSKAMRTAAVLVLRRLKSDKIALFLKDADEYIVTEAARAINDDLSIPGALPALAGVLKEKRFTSEPLLRRAINAALRVGSTLTLEDLIAFSKRPDLSDALKSEALATLGTWAKPSLTDRVDGRYRGSMERDPGFLRAALQKHVPDYLASSSPAILIAVAGLLANADIDAYNNQVAQLYATTKEPSVKAAFLPTLNQLKYNKIESVIKSGMEDEDENVRTAALKLLNDANVSKESLQPIVNSIFSKGGHKEQQQLLVVLGKLSPNKTTAIFERLIEQLRDGKLSPKLKLELQEAVEATGSAALKTKLAAVLPKNTRMESFADALEGGNVGEGRNIFLYNNTAQCMRCHAIGTYGTSTAGPNLAGIGSLLSREQLLQALVDPSARLSPGFGNVSLKLTDGQEVYGLLAKETPEALNIKTGDAEPLIIPVSRIAKRTNLPSSMPDMGESLSKREIRDLVEFLSSQKK